MVEDHGSDFSTEDDYQHHTTEVDLWDMFWQVQPHDAMKAEHQPPTDPTVETPEIELSGDITMAQQKLPGTRVRAPSSESHRRLVSRPVNEQRLVQHLPRTPKPPPKTSYSLFPPTESDRRLPETPPLSLLSRQPGPEPSTSAIRKVATEAKGNFASHNAASRAGSSRATTPGLPHDNSIAASSSDSIPLLLRSPMTSPQPSPPASLRGKSSTPELLGSPKYPWLKTGQRTPSFSDIRNGPLSKSSTRSSPALVRIARKQGQTQPQPQLRGVPSRAQITADLLARPLPPLPANERPPSPPNISVFETDSDDEADDEAGAGNAKKFARRLMHGLVQHHHDHTLHVRRNKTPGFLDHKRSVSDEGPASAFSRAGGGGGRHGISRAVYAARHRRAGTSGTVSMDLPRENHQQQVSESDGSSSRSKGEVFWERIFTTMRRKA
ncbi:hypothetical protein MMYC01_203986 [Madurella mycetomatis]|uniref:Uncharacterized protein n=1 Tax=Madurella mycetomatis TaxID=100816 RepID=A0A175W6K6_9PEZI|nr:hypothetical protein MMYC01_203986 [Madurella mycetomatis]